MVHGSRAHVWLLPAPAGALSRRLQAFGGRGRPSIFIITTLGKPAIAGWHDHPASSFPRARGAMATIAHPARDPPAQRCDSFVSNHDWYPMSCRLISPSDPSADVETGNASVQTAWVNIAPWAMHSLTQAGRRAH
ncbi:hypothetical protein BO71DRAFT_39146 [Aspergillus ellipticus CBS 707.79]|uniref:Uncharacterized protein n=1 Tax=Aspergillus ellipticus CBS 707.79 TaxID=1448320 RepID=A0A319D3P1_9EURO|nr:hypothetical protein BO71DRAFT_39146 [Aspergillus ellipticus CBS 707.79]